MDTKSKIREVVTVIYNHSNNFEGKLETIEIATNQILGFSTWQPIESAPKDGTIVDLWHVFFGRITETWWDDDCWVTIGIVEGFSHWMLPPEPPNAS